MSVNIQLLNTHSDAKIAIITQKKNEEKKTIFSTTNPKYRNIRSIHHQEKSNKWMNHT